MKTCNKSLKKLLVIFALVLPLALTGKVFGSDCGARNITPDLTAQWWQWALSIPSSVSPLTDKASDPTGAGFCMVGQRGDVWFLGGSFKSIDVTPAIKTTESGSGITVSKIVRKCKIPLGKSILIPVLNGECNTAEELAYNNPVPTDLKGKTVYLRQCAETQADAILKSTLAASFGSENGVLSPVNIKRVKTTVPFSIVYSPDNILSQNCPNGPGQFLCDPAPNPSLAQADGYWVQVTPAKAGTYTLKTYGEVPQYEFALDITYTIEVVGPEEQ